jgi:hypothetical protein
MSQNVKSSRRPKFGPRALKILRHLVENPYATQKELLALIRPEALPSYIFDYDKLNVLELKLGRFLKTSKFKSNPDIIKVSCDMIPSARWGNSYLARRQGCNGDRASLILRGVVAVSNIKRGRCLTYVITPKGMAVLAGLI